MPDVFAMLETDHRNVESMLGQLADSEEGPEREAVVAKLTQSLQLHMMFEEQDVYPVLERLDQEMEQEAEIEHTLARDGVAKVVELVGAPGFGAAVEMVRAGIQHHVEEEEQQVFPKLRAACDDATVARLGETLIKRKAEAGTLADDLEGATKDTILELAAEYRVEGRSSMTKAELITALTATLS